MKPVDNRLSVGLVKKDSQEAKHRLRQILDSEWGHRWLAKLRRESHGQRCPKCDSQRSWIIGVNAPNGVPVPVWRCRNCGQRFVLLEKGARDGAADQSKGSAVAAPAGADEVGAGGVGGGAAREDAGGDVPADERPGGGEG